MRWFAVAVYLTGAAISYIITSYAEFPWWARIVTVCFGLFLAFLVVNTIDEDA